MEDIKITCNLADGFCQYRFQEGSLFGCKFERICQYQAPLLTTLSHEAAKLPGILHNNITPGFVEEQFPKGKCRERAQALVLHAKMLIWFNDFTARLYEQPEGLKKREPSEINGNLFVSIEMYNNIFNQAIDLAIPIVNKLKSELEQAKLKIAELENTDNLRREMLEEARKEIEELRKCPK